MKSSNRTIYTNQSIDELVKSKWLLSWRLCYEMLCGTGYAHSLSQLMSEGIHWNNEQMLQTEQTKSQEALMSCTSSWLEKMSFIYIYILSSMLKGNAAMHNSVGPLATCSPWFPKPTNPSELDELYDRVSTSFDVQHRCSWGKTLF